MAIDPEAVKARWEAIRRDPDCDLSLTPESVSRYLGKAEAAIVKERISETLIQLADYYRVQGFLSHDPQGPGDLATCEGLESFLVPAVEYAHGFSEFLSVYQSKEPFVEALCRDIEKLLQNWEKGVFQGEPYSKQMRIEAVLDANFLEAKGVNITEAAAMACRVLIHLLTLKLNRPNEEKLFCDLIGNKFDDDRLLLALKAAVSFLVESFQKGDGKTVEDRIANSQVKGKSGSGWSWTNWDRLPPLLFFTAAAVDAFAELDLYLIRDAAELKNGTEGQQKIYKFYSDNLRALESFQLCVEMSKQWVKNEVLLRLCKGFGEYVDKAHEPHYDVKEYEDFKADIRRAGLNQPPMGFYNNLYALQIFLWSWADRDEYGSDFDLQTKERINRALAQLVYNYDSIPVVKEVLGSIGYTFALPTESPEAKFAKEKEEFTYYDSGFLPLLTRLLVLFVVYGVGDRNLLEPVIRSLYIELMQNRDRSGKVNTSSLWSAKGVEIFSTMRALQALTFYHAYARGKEQAERKGRGHAATDELSLTPLTMPETIVLGYKTGTSLVFKATSADAATPTEASTNDTLPEPMMEAIPLPDKFNEYCRGISPTWKPFSGYEALEGGSALYEEITTEGQVILSEYHNRSFGDRDTGAVNLVLVSLAALLSDRDPEKDMKVRRYDLEVLRAQHKQLLNSTPR